MPLEEIVKSAPAGGIFNNAAQIWNHTFYFEGLAPHAHHIPSKSLYTAIDAKWGDLDTFIAEFTKSALANFGSGWTWLVKKKDGSLDIVNTSAANTPLRRGDGDSQGGPASGKEPSVLDKLGQLPSEGSSVPLLTCDIWEHAYYIDYRNARAKYLENFWKVVDWNKISERYGSI